MAKPVLLTVDDDREVLRAIERDLRRKYGSDYRVLRSESGSAALEMVRELRPRSIELTREYDETLPRIKAYGSELNLVWTNLIVNAVDAMPEGGRLKVRTRKEPTDIMIEIRDNGSGIPEGLKSRIFEPFFTTKPVGEGTGLGLDTVARIVRKHHGNIRFESKPGDTCFQVRLPLDPLKSDG